MSTSVQRPALLDLPLVAEFLGQPLNSVRRWIHRPPEGFPRPVRLGAKITYRTSEIEAWALGGTAMSAQAAPTVVPLPVPRQRGRPPKQPKVVVATGQKV